MYDILIDEIYSCIDKYREKFILKNDFTVELGVSGLMIFDYYYAIYKKDEFKLNKARNFLFTQLNRLNEPNFQFELSSKNDSISNQLSGLGKSLNIIQIIDKSIDLSDVFSSINDLLIDLNVNNKNSNDLDFNSGLLASGNYFINYNIHKNEYSIKLELQRIIKRIKRCAITINPEEICWKSPRLNDRIFTGISHGSAMIINFLVNTIKFDLVDKKYKELAVDLIKKAVNFIKNQKNLENSSIFPFEYSLLGQSKFTQQFSLCYGSLGTALSIFNSAYYIGDVELQKEMRQIINLLQKVKFDSTKTYDGSIIYGVTGIALLYDRLYLETKEEKFKENSQYWIDCLKNCDKKKSVFSGFESMLSPDSIELNISFGWGILGIAIVLLSNSNPKLPRINQLTYIGIE